MNALRRWGRAAVDAPWICILLVFALLDSMRAAAPVTRWQRLVGAFFWTSVGFACAAVFVAYLRLAAPVPPVTLLQPVVEHSTDQYTVHRLRFEWRGTEKSCEFVVYHDRLTWRLQCPLF